MLFEDLKTPVADVALLAVVTRTRAAFPALELRIGTAWSFELLAQVQAGQTDIATLMLPSPSALSVEKKQRG